jgi:hypothetical protein
MFWDPIPELSTPAADLLLVFLSANGVSFWNRTDDPWYRGTIPGWIEHAAAYGAYQLYSAEVAASPLCCVQQYQFCNATGYCGPLAGFNEAVEGAVAFFNASQEIMNNSTYVPVGRMASRLNWYLDLINVPTQSLFNQLDSAGASALLSQQNIYNAVLGPIPNNQWQLDVQYWWATQLANVQASFVAAAIGPRSPVLREFSYLPGDSGAQSICDNQVGLSLYPLTIIPSDHTSVEELLM